MDNLHRRTTFTISKCTVVTIMVHYFKKANGISWTEILNFSDCTENEECRQKIYPLFLEVITAATLLIPRFQRNMEIVLRAILLVELYWINAAIKELSSELTGKPKEQHRMEAAAIGYTILSALVGFEFGMRLPRKTRSLLLVPQQFMLYSTRTYGVVKGYMIFMTLYYVYMMSLQALWILVVAIPGVVVCAIIEQKEYTHPVKMQALQNLAAAEIVLAFFVPTYWYLPFTPHLPMATLALYLVFRLTSIHGSQGVSKTVACAFETLMLHYLFMTILGVIQWVINFLLNSVYYSVMLALFIAFLVVQLACVMRTPYVVLSIVRWFQEQQAEFQAEQARLTEQLEQFEQAQLQQQAQQQQQTQLQQQTQRQQRTQQQTQQAQRQQRTQQQTQQAQRQQHTQQQQHTKPQQQAQRQQNTQQQTQQTRQQQQTQQQARQQQHNLPQQQAQSEQQTQQLTRQQQPTQQQTRQPQSEQQTQHQTRQQQPTQQQARQQQQTKPQPQAQSKQQIQQTQEQQQTQQQVRQQQQTQPQQQAKSEQQTQQQTQQQTLQQTQSLEQAKSEQQTQPQQQAKSEKQTQWTQQQAQSKQQNQQTQEQQQTQPQQRTQPQGQAQSEQQTQQTRQQQQTPGQQRAMEQLLARQFLQVLRPQQSDQNQQEFEQARDLYHAREQLLSEQISRALRRHGIQNLDQVPHHDTFLDFLQVQQRNSRSEESESGEEND